MSSGRRSWSPPFKLKGDWATWWTRSRVRRQVGLGLCRRLFRTKTSKILVPVGRSHAHSILSFDFFGLVLQGSRLEARNDFSSYFTLLTEFFALWCAWPWRNTLLGLKRNQGKMTTDMQNILGGASISVSLKCLLALRDCAFPLFIRWRESPSSSARHYGCTYFYSTDINFLLTNILILYHSLHPQITGFHCNDTPLKGWEIQH